MHGEPEPISVTPEVFEREVRKLLDAAGSSEQLVNYKSEHRRKLSGLDGDYEIDVFVSFAALGGAFKVLVECKHQKAR